MNEDVLQEIYGELRRIREKLEDIEELIVPVEEVSDEELAEIRKLKEESKKGQHIQWEVLKRELGV